MSSFAGIVSTVAPILGAGASIFSNNRQANQSFSTGMVGVQNIQQGGLLQQQGLNVTAGGFRSSGQSAVDASIYNAELTVLDLKRQEEFIRRQIPRVISSQRAQASGSGFDVASQSTLNIMNSTLDSIDREVIIGRQNAQLQVNSQLYQGKVAQAESENRARAAEFQGQIAAHQAQVQAQQAQHTLQQNRQTARRQTTSSVISGVATAAGAVADLFTDDEDDNGKDN